LQGDEGIVVITDGEIRASGLDEKENCPTVGRESSLKEGSNWYRGDWFSDAQMNALFANVYVTP